ncbi:hypothetical protein M747DRAFT_273831 [Aspergillus niger ATCC 13496]|uniref:Contig An13c0120, genomic contig n=3 Tax=Aspergillus niger TaxID=5061 RepID=A2R275_ASPNC|nr:uncharacterized protein An13g03820 [Aspergillus niger]RDH24429.1 hypothetical protein M747DRAFT_273831 [Aspergillus niger ATCC 13496]CAK41775.1 unnamed protein product [Aspergillus niger]
MTRDTIVLKATDSCIKPSLRTRTGCLTCRRRKKRCDERRPSCTGCQRNRLECQWESAGSLIWPKRRRARGTGAEKLLPDQAQRMVNVFSVLTPDIVSRLLRHFLNASPRWLSTRTGPRRTDYMKWLSPALSKSHVVRSCVLAIAAADLLKYYGNHPQLQHAAFEYYGQAVSSLRRAIESELSFDSSSDAFSSDYTPLSVLLLCLHETQNFTSRERILPHLNAAAFLLQNRIRCDSIDTDLRGYLFEMFCYFFALARFSLGSELLIAQADRIFASPSIIQHIQHGHIMGISQSLFIAIYRICHFSHDMQSSISADRSSARQGLLLLDQELTACQSQLTIDPSMDQGHLNDVITSNLYSLACRIHIKALLTHESDETDTVHSLMEEFINNLQHLPPHSPSHNILCWPLVIAGLSAKTSAYQRIIVAKLNNIHEEWKSAVFSKSADFLRELWRRDRVMRRRLAIASGYEYSSTLNGWQDAFHERFGDHHAHRRLSELAMTGSTYTKYISGWACSIVVFQPMRSDSGISNIVLQQSDLLCLSAHATMRDADVQLESKRSASLSLHVIWLGAAYHGHNSRHCSVLHMTACCSDNMRVTTRCDIYIDVNKELAIISMTSKQYPFARDKYVLLGYLVPVGYC